jgi:hypothetical protein
MISTVHREITGPKIVPDLPLRNSPRRPQPRCPRRRSRIRLPGEQATNSARLRIGARIIPSHNANNGESAEMCPYRDGRRPRRVERTRKRGEAGTIARRGRSRKTARPNASVRRSAPCVRSAADGTVRVCRRLEMAPWSSRHGRGSRRARAPSADGNGIPGIRPWDGDGKAATEFTFYIPGEPQ